MKFPKSGQEMAMTKKPEQDNKDPDPTVPEILLVDKMPSESFHSFCTFTFQ